MLLTISTTHQPATDLGYLLYKHPDRVQTVSLSFGKATVAYTEASEKRCTAAMIVDVDPVELIRGGRDAAREAVTLGQYVNDRPYASSSFLSTAISKVFGTAMSGRSKDRQELAETAIPLRFEVPAMACRGGENLLRRVFEPLGYEVTANEIQLDDTIPHWGKSRYLDVTLEATVVLKEALEHLYVLIPVLDDSKHYWVGEEEIERLVRRGGTWLAAHPEQELITTRALRHDRQLTKEVRAQLASIAPASDDADSDAVSEEEASDENADREEAVVEDRVSLNDQRMTEVIRILGQHGATRVADLGCGEGRLVDRILRDLPKVERVLAVDVSMQALRRASRRLHIETMSPSMRKRVDLLQGALTYRDQRLLGVDTVTLIEVIEHVDEFRLEALERVVFGYVSPRTVIVTTPNVEYNALFKHQGMRHRDHRFEWTRTEFATWAESVAATHGYTVSFHTIGPVDPTLGAPTQMGVFVRGGVS